MKNPLFLRDVSKPVTPKGSWSLIDRIRWDQESVNLGGGHWYGNTMGLRSAWRFDFTPASHRFNYGFRLFRTKEKS